MGQRSLRDATVTLEDGAGTPLTVVVKVGEGNISFTERRNVEYIRDRGVIDTVRLGDDEPVDVSFDFVWDWIQSTTLSTDTDSIRDIIRGDGFTTTGESCEPYACNIEIVITACSNTETITLADFRFEELSYDLRNGTISCSGKCNIAAATVTAS
tara:strand:+ start:27 stop:491 length:465 start_codon:yes stop_codon:yes gene_type:complete